MITKTPTPLRALHKAGPGNKNRPCEPFLRKGEAIQKKIINWIATPLLYGGARDDDRVLHQTVESLFQDLKHLNINVLAYARERP